MLQSRSRGFTLIELAVVTAIIGLLVAGAVTGVGALRTNTKIKETQRQLDVAETLLQNFVARNGRLPCPALPTATPLDADYLQEARANGSVDDPRCSAWQVNGSVDPDDEGIFVGILPAYALGNNPRQGTDGWDSQIFYVVVGRAARNNSASDGIWALDDQNEEIELWDREKDDSVPGEPVPRLVVNKGVVALISYGANRNGAWTLDAQQLPAPPAGALAENDNQDADIYFAAAVYSDSATEPFDDLVRVKTEEEIIRPLADHGLLKTKPALTAERLDRLIDLIYGYARLSLDDPDQDIPDPPPPECAPLGVECVGSRTATHNVPRSDGFVLTGDASFARQNLAAAGALVGRFPILDNAFLSTAMNLTDIRDAWGNYIEYDPGEDFSNPDNGDAVTDEGIDETSTETDPVFVLRSRGPDGETGTADDIRIQHSLMDALGILARSQSPR